MSETEERAAAKALWETLGIRLIDDDDWTFDENGTRVSACGIYWLVLNGHDDERLDEPIRYGQWPRITETIIKSLWHHCVALSVNKAQVDAKQMKIQRKLSVAASALMISSLAVPLLMKISRLVDANQFDRILHDGTYLAAAGLGALLALWCRGFDQDI